MVRTGQIKMEVNQVHEQEPDQEEELGEVNALKPGTVCYKCNKNNYLAKDCRSSTEETATRATARQKKTETKRKKVVCYNCNEAGHYSNRCTKPQKGEETNRVSQLEQKVQRIADCLEKMMDKSVGFQSRV